MMRRTMWFAAGMTGLTLIGALVVGGAAYWAYANQLPPYIPRSVALPVPNAYDDYVLAAAMSRAVGGSGTTFRDRDRQVPPARLSAVVKRNWAALARLRLGFGKQCGAPPAVSFHQTFPELAGYRDLARVLVAEGKLAERQGRMVDAAHSYRDCLRFGVDVPRGGTLIHGQVGIAIQDIGLRALEESIDRLDGPTAAHLAQAMQSLDQRATSFAATLANEKEAMTLCLRELLRHSTVWEALIPGQTLQGFLYDGMEYGLPTKRAVLACYRSYMDAGIADASRPYYATALPPWRGIIQHVTPELSTFKPKWAVRDARWRIMELLLAAREYQHRHGRPPPAADALVPLYLAAVPRDPFADRVLIYRVRANRVLVYSRGPDGKDDGGKDLGASIYSSSSGDIVTLKPRQPTIASIPGTPPPGPAATPAQPPGSPPNTAAPRPSH
jgi:hypothetical protein